ncbi:MAG: autotransporter-associated beta strand repeat-containing protein, partial [bacterium]
TSGNGGQVETSSHNNLQALGNVDASASAGQAGDWLLDPRNVNIAASGAIGTAYSTNFIPTATSTILASSIVASLNAGTSVTISTGSTGTTDLGYIVVNSAIATGSFSGTRTLTLTAASDIQFNAGISNSTGTLDIVLNAGGAIQSNTTNAAISGLGTTTFNVSNISGSGTYSSVISKTNLIKTGAGTLVLSGINTYTGTTTINGGTLQNGAAGVIANSSAVTVASGATWNLYNFAENVGSIAGAGNIVQGTAALTAGGDNSSTTFSGIISGTGTLTKTGSGTLTLSGANTKSGINTVSGTGTLLIDTTAALPGSITVDSGATLATKKNLGNTLTVNGTLDLQGVAFSTGVNFNTGSTLTASTGTSSFSASWDFTGTTLDAGSGAQLTLSGILSGDRGLTKGTGAGTVVLSNLNNTLSGGMLGSPAPSTTINGGVLSIASGTSLGDAIGIVFNNGGTLKIAAGGTLDAGYPIPGSGGSLFTSYTFNAGGGTIDVTDGISSVYSTKITGTGVFTKAGAGEFDILRGSNSYNSAWASTAVNVNAGILKTLGYTNSTNFVSIMPSDAAVTVATGATWQTNYIEYAGSLAGGGKVVLGNYLAVGDNGTDS